MRIAILTPTIYRPAGLHKSLSSLRDTTSHIDNVDIVIAAEKDDDEARHIADKYDAIFTVCEEPLQGCAYAWNQAMKAALDYDAYFTGSDDIEYINGWLDEVLRVLAEPPLNGSGFVGINDARKDARKFCATHYLMTRDFIIEHNGGVMAAPFYFANWTDMEADRRARKAGKWAWAEKAVVKHLWRGPYGDTAYTRAYEARAEAKLVYEDRLKRGFPDDFEPIIKNREKISSS